MDLCAALHPVDMEIMGKAIGLVERNARLDIADAVHVSTALVHGIAAMLSADHGLDGVEGIERVDPLDSSRLTALASD
jgi:predicted nucleic acid-binding protein